jgi:DNA processing protein
MGVVMATRRRATGGRPSAPYVPPSNVATTTRAALLSGARSLPDRAAQASLAFGLVDRDRLWCAGDIGLAQRPCVAIVGTRQPSSEGERRAARLARELAEASVVVVSGLAAGIDHAAHVAAIEAGGSTIAVIGTPIDRNYPAAHAELQMEIARHHLLVSQFAPGTRTFPAMFPERNKLMAALTDATVIVEAGETSGTIHQAAECVRLGRWLFFMKSLVDQRHSWVDGFLKQAGVRVLCSTSDVLSLVAPSRP